MEALKPLLCQVSIVFGCEVEAPVRGCECSACRWEAAEAVRVEWFDATQDLGGEG
jgi:hypothetical protein